MSFEVKQLRNNRIKIQKVESTPQTIEYQVTGGKINNITLQSMISNGYKKNPKSNKDIDGYVQDKELSGTRAQVYYHPEKDHLVVNHRGTKGMQDVMTDIGLMFNNKSGKRFQHGKKITDAALKKYDTDNVTISGHSLGSQVAKESNQQHGKESIVVNPAVTPYDLLNRQKDSETVIRSKLDPISYLHTFSPFANKARTIDIEAKSYNPLKEHSSDILLDLGDTDVGV